MTKIYITRKIKRNQANKLIFQLKNLFRTSFNFSYFSTTNWDFCWLYINIIIYIIYLHNNMTYIMYPLLSWFSISRDLSIVSFHSIKLIIKIIWSLYLETTYKTRHPTSHWSPGLLIYLIIKDRLKLGK